MKSVGIFWYKHKNFLDVYNDCYKCKQFCTYSSSQWCFFLVTAWRKQRQKRYLFHAFIKYSNFVATPLFPFSSLHAGHSHCCCWRYCGRCINRFCITSRRTTNRCVCWWQWWIHRLRSKSDASPWYSHYCLFNRGPIANILLWWCAAHLKARVDKISSI